MEQVAGPQQGRETQLVRPSRRFLPVWFWSVAANVAVITVFWCARLAITDKRHPIENLLELTFGSLVFGCLAMWSVTLVCGVPRSIFNWIVAAIVWIAAMVGTHCVAGGETPGRRIVQDLSLDIIPWLMPQIFVLALMAAFPFRVAGMQLTARDQVEARPRWQYSLATIFSVIVIASIYLGIIVNLMQNGRLTRIADLVFPTVHYPLDRDTDAVIPPPSGETYIGMLIGMVFAIIATMLFLRYSRASAWVVGLAVSLVFVFLYCEMTGIDLVRLSRRAVGLSVMLASQAIIALPWSMAGFRTHFGTSQP